MSGRKYSGVEIVAAEQRRRLALVAEIESARRVVWGIEQQMHDILGQASGGVRQMFAEEDRVARGWLQRAQTDQNMVATWSGDQAPAVLAAAQLHLQRLADNGRAAWVRLLEAFRNRAARVRQELRGRLVTLEGSFGAHSSRIGRWLGEDRRERLTDMLKQAADGLQMENFAAAEGHLRNLEQELPAAVSQASRMEGDQVRREQARRFLELRHEIEVRAAGLRHRLHAASEGLRTTFTEEVSAAMTWLTQECSVRECDGVSSESDTDELEKASARLGEILKKGQAAEAALGRAFTERTADLRARSEAEVAALAVQLDGGRTLLQRWFDEAEVAALQQALAELRESLRAERFLDLPTSTEQLRSRLHERLAWAEEQETLHQRRLYLLKGLRQVCQDLHFAEIGTLDYEKPGDRRSRIVFTVDTKDHGRVTFHLALDSLSADACLARTHCADEFNRISALLKRKFGVQTAFHTGDEPSMPIARNSRELEEPDDGEAREEGRYA